MKRVKAVRFIRRSSLPLRAACVVANGVRETLASAFGTAVVLRLFPPLIPDPHAWPAIFREAHIYRLSGAAAEAILIVRDVDARMLAAAAFGESEASMPALSSIERTVLERIVALLGLQLSAICGGSPKPEPVADPGPVETYFELQIERPVLARIGIGLRFDPAESPVPALEFADIADIPIELRVHIELGPMPLARILDVQPGDVLAGAGTRAGVLSAAGRVLALGECGVSGGRYAFTAQRLATNRGSNFVQ